MLPWQKLQTATAPDGTPLELRRRGDEMLILAGGYDLMSTADEASSRALADLGCGHISPDSAARIVVGGLGMGYTLRAALDRCHATSVVEVVELVGAVADWNRAELSGLADRPLEDPRTKLTIGDVADTITQATGAFDAILLDVDNGPDALAHSANAKLLSRQGVARAWRALRPEGTLAVWSFSDDVAFTKQLRNQGFSVERNRVPGSRTGRGRFHIIWVARRS